MKNRWTTHSWNGAIWLALSSCHMTMTCKINKLEKPGGPLGIFHALFVRSAAFYGHFRADAVTSEWSTCISSSTLRRMNTSTNWLINTNWSVDCRMLRIIEFEITRLFKKTYYMNMSCDSASWLKIQVNSIFIEQPVLS